MKGGEIGRDGSHLPLKWSALLAINSHSKHGADVALLPFVLVVPITPGLCARASAVNAGLLPFGLN